MYFSDYDSSNSHILSMFDKSEELNKIVLY